MTATDTRRRLLISRRAGAQTVGVARLLASRPAMCWRCSSAMAWLGALRLGPLESSFGCGMTVLGEARQAGGVRRFSVAMRSEMGWPARIVCVALAVIALVTVALPPLAAASGPLRWSAPHWSIVRLLPALSP